MSENTTATVPANIPNPPKAPRPDLSKVVPYLVTRNTVEKALTPLAGSRKTWDGVVYQAPQVRTTENTGIIDDPLFIEDLAWAGKDNIVRALNVIWRRLAQDAHADAIPEHDNEPGFPEGSKAGVFVAERFIKSIENFTTSSLRISELVELYEEANAAFQRYTSNELIPAIMACNGDVDKIAEIKAYVKKLGDTVNQYKLEIDERRAKKSKEANTDEVRPE